MFKPLRPAVGVDVAPAVYGLASRVRDGFLERDVLTRQQDTEDGRRVVWCDTELHRLGEHGDTELEDVALEDLDDGEVRQLARSSIYTWGFTNTSILDSPIGDTPAEVSAPTQAVANGGDRPPDNAD